MQETFTVYRIVGYSKKYCQAVCECATWQSAEDICQRLKKSEAKSKDVVFEVNPALCPVCLKSGQRILIPDGKKDCGFHEKS